MKDPLFFFDTADVEYIRQTWSKLESRITPNSVAGITTNPNAFHKIEANTIQNWKDKTLELCKLVSDIRQDSLGVVFVQQPNSQMQGSDVLKWASLVSEWGDGKTRVGIKIPPFKNVLEVADELSTITNNEVNVTGVSDCSTALRAFSYKVRYVSIIPGRMEEKGIDAKAQVSFTNQRKPDNSNIITGSMRTLEGLKWVCQYGTVPTIGNRVWDSLFEEGLSTDKCAEEFKSFWNQPKELIDPLFSPIVDNNMTSLSQSFFQQMDKLGESVYREFHGNICY